MQAYKAAQAKDQDKFQKAMMDEWGAELIRQYPDLLPNEVDDLVAVELRPVVGSAHGALVMLIPSATLKTPTDHANCMRPAAKITFRHR